MKSFGNALGNCLNDKDYIRMVGCKPKKAPAFDLRDSMNGDEEATGLKEIRLRALREGRMNRTTAAPINRTIEAPMVAAPTPKRPEASSSSSGKENDPLAAGLETPKSSQTSSQGSGEVEVVKDASKSAPPLAAAAGKAEDLSKAERLRKAKLKQQEFERNKRKRTATERTNSVESAKKDEAEATTKSEPKYLPFYS